MPTRAWWWTKEGQCARAVCRPASCWSATVWLLLDASHLQVMCCMHHIPSFSSPGQSEGYSVFTDGFQMEEGTKLSLSEVLLPVTLVLLSGPSQLPGVSSPGERWCPLSLCSSCCTHSPRAAAVKVFGLLLHSFGVLSALIQVSRQTPVLPIKVKLCKGELKYFSQFLQSHLTGLGSATWWW